MIRGTILKDALVGLAIVAAVAAYFIVNWLRPDPKAGRDRRDLPALRVHRGLRDLRAQAALREPRVLQGRPALRVLLVLPADRRPVPSMSGRKLVAPATQRSTYCSQNPGTPGN